MINVHIENGVLISDATDDVTDAFRCAMQKILDATTEVLDRLDIPTPPRKLSHKQLQRLTPAERAEYQRERTRASNGRKRLKYG